MIAMCVPLAAGSLLACEAAPENEGSELGGEVNALVTSPTDACLDLDVESGLRNVEVQRALTAGVETSIQIQRLPLTHLTITGTLYANPDCTGDLLMVAEPVDLELSLENPVGHVLLNFVGAGVATIDAKFEGFAGDCSPLLNGSFEESLLDPSGGLVLALPVNDTSITSWTVTQGDVDYIGGYWQASNGVRSLDLSGYQAGAVSQTFGTVAGARYEVRFDLSGEPFSHSPVVKELRVSAADTSEDYTFDSTLSSSRSDMYWQEQVFEFTATSDTSTLTFTSLSEGDAGPALDNVSVTGVCQTP